MFEDRHLYLNGEELDLDEDVAIPINKQVNDIGELKDRQADFTADFKLGATRKNVRLLENAQLVGSKTRIPYTRNAVKYVEGGIEIIPSGYLAVNGYANGYFTCVVYSGVADFFKSIEGLKLSNLNLTDLNHPFNGDVFTATPAGVKWLVFEPSKEGDALQTQKARLENFRPFVSAETLVERIVTAQGWTAEYPAGLFNGWVLCPSLTPNTSAYYAERRLTSPSALKAVALDPTTATTVTDNKGLFNPVGAEVGLSRRGKYRFTISGKFLMTNATKFSLTLRADVNATGGGSDTTTEIASNLNNRVLQDYSVVYEYDTPTVNFYSRLYFVAQAVGSGASMVTYEMSVKVQLVESSFLYGDTVEVASALPDLEQSKYIKTLANMYGLTLQPDTRRKILRMLPFNTLYDNLHKAQDWSDYISPGTESLTYRVGKYAANNLLKYKGSEEVPAGYGDGSIALNDQLLEGSKDMFTLDCKATLDIVYNTKFLALIPVCEKQDGGFYKNNGNNDFRMVLAQQVTDNPIHYNDGGAGGGLTINVPSYYKAYFIGATDSLSFALDLIPKQYSGLQRTLNSSKAITCKAALPLHVLPLVDHLIPVYLSQHAANFYVNKITGWRKDTLCTLELIKL